MDWHDVAIADRNGIRQGVIRVRLTRTFAVTENGARYRLLDGTRVNSDGSHRLVFDSNAVVLDAHMALRQDQRAAAEAKQKARIEQEQARVRSVQARQTLARQREAAEQVVISLAEAWYDVDRAGQDDPVLRQRLRHAVQYLRAIRVRTTPV